MHIYNVFYFSSGYRANVRLSGYGIFEATKVNSTTTIGVHKNSGMC